jgi:hypothetical protein
LITFRYDQKTTAIYESSPDRPKISWLSPNETVMNLCSGTVSFSPFYGHVRMKTPTHPLQSKIVTQTPGDEPNFSTAIWAIGGFIIFAAVIFLLVIYSPL